MKAPQFSLRTMLLFVAWLALVFFLIGQRFERQRLDHVREIQRLEQRLAGLKDLKSEFRKKEMEELGYIIPSPSPTDRAIAEVEKELAKLRGER